MKIMSLALEGAQLKAVEVEIILIPGLPQIHFLGLPDQIIRESIHRIKSAIRHQGFEFPKTNQVLVNIRPAHVKKSSRGLELAVAAGILWVTEQLPKPISSEKFFVYGELGLAGEVYQPEDLSDFDGDADSVILTGPSDQAMKFHRQVVTSLREISQPQNLQADLSFLKAHRPEFGLNLSFDPDQARLIEILSLGGHHGLLAGPAGSGKSTMAKAVGSFLPEPTSEELYQLKASWRPVIAPHHSITSLSLIGGGVPPKPGEIVRANKGVLVMDELLEFSPASQEALREPLEEGMVRITRGMRTHTFKSRFQLIATTNLCPCGQWVPGTDPHCRFSRSRCVSYQQRLSGPFLDRFEVLYFAKKPSQENGIEGKKILEKLETSREWKKSVRFNKNRMDEFAKKNLVPKEFPTRRREKAFSRVCETLADLDLSEDVKSHHIEEALHLTYHHFDRLNRGF